MSGAPALAGNRVRTSIVPALAGGLLVWAFALTHGGAGAFGGLLLGIVTAVMLAGLLDFLFSGGDDSRAPVVATVAAAATGQAAAAIASPAAGIARPARPAGMDEAPHGATLDPRAAVTFRSDMVAGGDESAHGDTARGEQS